MMFFVLSSVAFADPETLEQAQAERLPKVGDAKFHRDPAEWPEAVRAPMLAAQARGLLLARRSEYARLAVALTGRSEMPVVQLNGTDATVHFVGEKLASAARVTFDSAHPTGVLQAGEAALDPVLARSVLAMRLAAADPRNVPKWPSYSRDAVPWSEDPAQGWAVYLLPSTTDLAHVPLGGGYRAHVSADGTAILAFDALSQTVIEHPVDQLRVRAGISTVSVLTPIPDATYVTFAKVWDVPLYVVTEDAAWGMQGDALYWMELAR